MIRDNGTGKPAPAAASIKRFSIFDPVVTFEHREFYERIVSELNGLFPICNQGKCSAVEISEDATEQEQITDLMVRVENFSGELLEVTKNLFDQFYQAKEAFHRMILSNVAYVKINLIDRNLLERTCDVRWWALETAFSDCLAEANAARNELGSLHRQFAALRNKLLAVAGRAEGAAGTEAGVGGAEGRVLGLLEKLLPFFAESSGILVRSEVFSEYAGYLGELKKMLATSDGAAGLVREIGDSLARLERLQDKVRHSCERLEDINTSYTLYRDLVICDASGCVIASSNAKARDRVLGMNLAEEAWFRRALQTKDGTEYCAQDLGLSAVEESPSLVYATAVRESSDNNGSVIGAMGVFFDFQGEAKIILEDYMNTGADGHLAPGWHSFLTSEKGMIIGASDEAIFQPGTLARIPRQHRDMGPGETRGSYLLIEGEDAALFSAKTKGYLEYHGLGWSSHLVVPKSSIFGDKYAADNTGISTAELMGTQIIPEINKQTYSKIQEDKESIQLISLNGIVFASKLGKRGVALGPIFDQITKTGDFATSRMEDLLAEMAAGELALNLRALELFSKQAIDLIDRNLFERSADIRWWATDRYFWEALMKPGEEAFQRACGRLKVINNSYTMYRNLVLANSGGEIVACSKMELMNELRKVNVSDQEWFQRGMRTLLSSEYAVQDVQQSPLERHKARSLIYSGGVRADGARQGDAIGVLGILFDWDTEAQTMLKTCLPHDQDGNQIAGCAAFYTNGFHEVIESSDSDRFPVGQKLQLPPPHHNLGDGVVASGPFTQGGVRYIMGTSKTQGYREYPGLKWCAHVVRPLD